MYMTRNDIADAVTPIPEEKRPEALDIAQSMDKEREKMHRQMLSSVSHDLKTPLASIIGSLEIHEKLKEKLSSEKRETLIHTALQEASRLDSFITNILDMAKLETGLVKPRPETRQLDAVIRDCLTRLGNRLRQSAITVAGLSGPLEIHTDVTLLCRVLGLLLDNAVKYGGTPSVIEMEHGIFKEYCFIRVRDNGKGVPRSQMKLIFSKYTRFTKQDQQTAGTGLGLAICAEIMRLLGGSIEVANHPGGGAVFTLLLPLQRS